jgi:uncharacterized membrane protein
MEETKSWWQSKTIWGAVITIIALIASLFGYQIDPQTQQIILDRTMAIVTAVGTIVGSVMAIYGRIKATKRIGRGNS